MVIQRVNFSIKWAFWINWCYNRTEIVREREPQQSKMIEPVMLERIRFILSVAANHGEKALVLGAFGCGVFRNNPKDVARMFKHVLVDEGYGTLFDLIVFAILDKTDEERTLNLFKREFL